MMRVTTPALAGLLLLLAGCSQNRYDPYPYPETSRSYPRNDRDYRDAGAWSPARRALEMKHELRLNDGQIRRLVVIERDYGRRDERREVDRVLNRRQREMLYRGWGR